MDIAGANIAQPDITLHLDLAGVITDVALSRAFADEKADALCGQRWADTVEDAGSEKVSRMLEDASKSGVSAFRQVNQRLPSGLQIPIEYTTVRLGRAGMVAIGKNLQTVADLQSRLVAAQQAMERDYWKLREVETRYRLLFDATHEAVLLIRASNMHVVEANPAAIRALGFAPADRDLLSELVPEQRDQFNAMLNRVRDQGKAPAILLQLGPDRAPWMVRASLMTSQPAQLFMVQLTPVESGEAVSLPVDTVLIETVIDRLPDGFVVLDGTGKIVRANHAFLDLAQMATERSVIGEGLGRWLGRPGADLKVLLANVEKHGFVRIFPTTLHGDLGTDCDVEISAARGNAEFIGLIVRDVGQRLPEPANANRLGTLLGSLTEQIGKRTLPQLVKSTVGVVEQHYLEAALKLTGGNRTAASELLGLSRQSLYTKLSKYGLDGVSQTAQD